jgi:hypothetical protein
VEIEEAHIKIICLEQRVDNITREFVEELKETNKLLEKLTDKVQNLENERIKAQSFIAGVVFIATLLGGALVFIFENLTNIKS